MQARVLLYRAGDEFRPEPPAQYSQFRKWGPPMTAVIIISSVLVAAALAVVLLNFKTPEKQPQRIIEHHCGVTDPQFRREMSVLMGQWIGPGNRVEALQNGDEIFPAMLKAIREAESTVNFETYIYWSGEIGRKFAGCLAEKARSGVTVNVLIDWMGSVKMDQSLVEHMRSSGVEVQRYHPLRWYSLDRLNNRTHRKILIVDGRIGFTGGVGVADIWLGNAQDPDHWRDIHFQVEGPVVAHMQAAFSDNWIKTTGRVLNGPGYFPELEPQGEMEAQMFISSPSGGAESMHLMYLMAIGAAESSIDLQAAYFIPDELSIKALLAAKRRGVRIRVSVPGEYIDSSLVRLSARSSWGELLAAGIEIYEYKPTMFHNKMLIVDRWLVSVGSTNFDLRSFRLNDEASLNVYDGGFAEEMTEVFERDLRSCTPYTYSDWEKRSLTDKAAEILLLPAKTQL